MKVLVIGNGLIGSACITAYESFGHSVLVYDTAPSRTKVYDADLKFALETADYVVSVVPTPPKSGGGFHLHMLKETAILFRDFASPKAIFVQRSTTLPGNAAMIALQLGILDRYVMSPSFAYRKSAPENETSPLKTVIGAKTLALAQKVADELYGTLPSSDMFLGSLEDAEMSKIASNLWQGLIISALNELKMSSRLTDSDFVMETLIREHNLHSIKRFHGKAFGKGGRLDDDMRAFATSDLCLKGSIFAAALDVNDGLRLIVGEENRPTSELEAMSFKGNISRAFGEVP